MISPSTSTAVFLLMPTSPTILLATIFLPKAPLHDGAVIVQKDKIAAAACFLPLATDPQLSSQMGTRHRAGIGITEETDAIAVIVSEETGGISVAHRGGIERDLTPEHLRERISELLRRYIPRTTLPTVETERELATADRQSRIRTRRKSTWLKGRNSSHARLLPPLRTERSGT